MLGLGGEKVEEAVVVGLRGESALGEPSGQFVAQADENPFSVRIAAENRGPRHNLTRFFELESLRREMPCD